MKKRVGKIIFVLLIAGLSLGFLSVPPGVHASEGGKTIGLKLAHSVPPVSQQHERVFVPWAKELEKRTNGRVKVQIFPAQQLGLASECYDLVIKGTVDLSWIIPSFFHGQFPLTDIFHLPFLIPSALEDQKARAVRKQLFAKYITPIHFKDVKVMWTGRTGANVIHMTSTPVRTMEDIKGKIIGFPGGTILPNFLKSAGASPVQVPVPDMYSSLEKKIIDGQVIPLETLVSFKLMDVVKYVTRLNAGGGAFLTIMSRKSFEELPSDIQKIIEEMNPWAETIEAEAWIGSSHFAESMAQKKNIELIDLSEQERAQWVELARPLEDSWAKEMDARGLPGTKMVEEARRMLKE